MLKICLFCLLVWQQVPFISIKPLPREEEETLRKSFNLHIVPVSLTKMFWIMTHGEWICKVFLNLSLIIEPIYIKNNKKETDCNTRLPMCLKENRYDFRLSEPSDFQLSLLVHLRSIETLYIFISRHLLFHKPKEH